MKHPKINQILEYVSEQIALNTDPETLKTEVLGRKGTLTLLMKEIVNLSGEDKIQFGKDINLAKCKIEEMLSGVNTKTENITVDLSLPKYNTKRGTIHPISAMIGEMSEIFKDLSFEIVEGNELVSDVENFEVLNMDEDHPARDTQDSFYISDKYLLRTQTSSVQVLEMSKRLKAGKLPIRIVSPGKTYRRESDATHSPMFHQIEGVLVDTNTSFSDLKGTLDYLAKRLFGENVETRFRPHHFPYTEPSAELDIRWKGELKSTGKHTGWLEWGGCGMIHPDVLKRAGLNPKIYRGWAFGMGIERSFMIRNQLPDVRLLYQNAISTLDQF